MQMLARRRMEFCFMTMLVMKPSLYVPGVLVHICSLVTALLNVHVAG